MKKKYFFWFQKDGLAIEQIPNLIEWTSHRAAILKSATKYYK